MKATKLFTMAIALLALFVFIVVVPASAKGTSKSSTKKEQTAKPKSTKPASIQKININKADLKTLTTLQGIGDKLAKAIIKHRKKNGPFKKPEDIMQVKGIGEKIFGKNKKLIRVK